MPRDPRYDILFEPVKIGPVTAKNRFFQAPHCNGMGYAQPLGVAAMRGVKAEGGWAVVCTEECEIHHTSDVAPYKEARLWDNADIPVQAKMVEAVHAHGGLAGVELVHNGLAASNFFSRSVPLAPSDRVCTGYYPMHARAMDKTDIRDLRRWHRAAAKRAKKAGFDLVYAYAGHNLTLPMHFLSRRYNERTDEYGGSLENRVRLFRELIEDTKDAIGDSCAVVVRFAVDELLGPEGITSEAEGHEVVEMLAELPDLWDVNVSAWDNDSQTSRFSPEGAQEPYVTFVKKLTSKPVVGVGRFTSPDSMVSQIKRGILDMLGAARPSIADPFLPKKIEEGRLEDIRECIGCNICVSGDWTMSPIRCTQNPTMGEEFRRGWHPERIGKCHADEAVLVVGAGPAGLEAARALGHRGYQVTLAEAGEELGGRVVKESALPGLSAWIRVRDYRVQQLNDLANVEIYRASELTAADVREFGVRNVVLATGAEWRRDGVGRSHYKPIPRSDGPAVFSPDDIMHGAKPVGPVAIFDDDHFYMGGVLAEKLRLDGLDVSLVTPLADVSHWCQNTMEQARIQTRLLEIGVAIQANRRMERIAADHVILSCTFTGKETKTAAGSVVLVTSQMPRDDLFRELRQDPLALEDSGISKLCRIGDCEAPGTIAAAVYSGHRYARELGDEPDPDQTPFRREDPLRGEVPG